MIRDQRRTEITLPGAKRSVSRSMEPLEARRLFSMSFAQMSDYPLPSRPTWAVEADFNGDGKPDVAVSINDSHQLSVLMGNGDGTFGPRADYATAGSTSLVATADFNNDGWDDLAVSLHATTSIQVFYNDGSGSFASSTLHTVGSDPLAIATADIDDDGWYDILVPNNLDNTVSVLRNDQSGSFAALPSLPTGAGPLGLAIADLDGDAILDLAVANNFGNTLSIFHGNGDGTFASRPAVPVGSRPHSVAAGDFNGDSAPDLVCTDYSPDQTISVVLNHGDATFAPRTAYHTGNAPVGVSTADFDLDGDDDIAVANTLSANVSIFPCLGDGTFDSKFELPGGDPAQPLVSDADNDGRPDILMIDNGANRMRVFLNDTIVVNPSTGVVSGSVWLDLNNDGQVDFGETGIAGVQVRLTGTNDLNQSVNLTLTTDADGAYIFSELRPGTYCVEEIQPAAYSDGIDVLGSSGGVIVQNDKFCDIVVEQDENCINYNFGERPLAGTTVQPGQTATIGFWQNKNGQNLIKAFNGGEASTMLGTWLAATLPNLFGANAGSSNLAGLSNAVVAAAFRQRFILKGVKVDAQLMATALSVYATTASLGGSVSPQYGFTVTPTGLSNATFSVGQNGSAFGVANGTVLTVLDLLQAADSQAVGGSLYGGNATLRRMANDVFSAINEAGDR